MDRAAIHYQKFVPSKNIGDGDDSQYAMLKKLELSDNDHMILIEYCKEKNIKFFSTAFDVSGVDYLETLDLDMFKIPSGEVTNYPYLRAIAQKGKPIILSTGMAGKKELDEAYELLEFCDAFSLLICQSLIPPEGRRMEISCGPDGTSYSLFQQQDRIIVEPWPFATSKFEVLMETRTIKVLKFSSDEQFRKLLKACPIAMLRWVIADK